MNNLSSLPSSNQLLLGNPGKRSWPYHYKAESVSFKTIKSSILYNYQSIIALKRQSLVNHPNGLVTE